MFRIKIYVGSMLNTNLIFFNLLSSSVVQRFCKNYKHSISMLASIASTCYANIIKSFKKYEVAIVSTAFYCILIIKPA